MLPSLAQQKQLVKPHGFFYADGMKKLRFRRNSGGTGISAIVTTMHEAGYEISPEDAEDAWQAFSDSFDATWLIVSAFSSQEIVDAVLSYCDEV